MLVHGYTAMPAEMRPLGDDLRAAGHTVLGVRLAGHGTHPDDLSRTTWRDWVATVADAVSLLEASTDRVVLVGQSLGGLVAVAAAAELPAAGLVTLNSPSEIRSPPGPPATELHRKEAAAHPELGVRREAGYPAYAAFSPEAERQIADLSHHVEQVLRRIDAPALVVGSTADPSVPVSSAEHLAARLPNARLLIVDGVGHAITMDSGGAEVFAAIRDFVADIDSRAARSAG